MATRNRKHRRAAAKPAAFAKPLMLSKVGRQRGIYIGREEGSCREGGMEGGRER